MTGEANRGGGGRLEKALGAIDAINAGDPRQLVVGGVARPKELVAGERVTYWLLLLEPEASEPLRLAARAHHLRRWSLPRQSYPEGRAGYKAWRQALQARHAEEVAPLLVDAGYGPEEVARVQALVRKRGLGCDPEAQALEDAICLAFLELEYASLADRVNADKMVAILEKTLPKMSERARQLALSLELGARERALLERAVAAFAARSAPGGEGAGGETP